MTAPAPVHVRDWMRGKPADADGTVRCDCGSAIPAGSWVCSACRAANEEKDRQRQAAQERARILARAEQGPRTAPDWQWARVGSEGFEKAVRSKRYRAAAARWKPEAGNLVLLGPTGCGKSTTAIAILWRLKDEALAEAYAQKTFQPCRLTESALWCAAYDLTRARKEHPLGQGEAPLVERACGATLLVLDDLGNEPVDTVVFEVLDARYQAGRPVIVTSGFSPEGLRERYGDALWRRCAERGTVLEERAA